MPTRDPTDPQELANVLDEVRLRGHRRLARRRMLATVAVAATAAAVIVPIALTAGGHSGGVRVHVGATSPADATTPAVIGNISSKHKSRNSAKRAISSSGFTGSIIISYHIIL